MIKKSSGYLNNKGWLTLLVSIVALVAVWGGILPRLARQPEVAARVIQLESKGIDPSAMFYTELEITEELSYRLEKAARENPDLLWGLKSR